MKTLHPILNTRKVSNEVAEIEILDAIVSHDEYLMELTYLSYDGEKPVSISAPVFRDKIKAFGNVSEIRVLINSAGGEVTNGMAIYETLKQHPARIVIDILGEAASTAGWITQAGDEVRISNGGMMMMHDPMMLTIGDIQEHEKAIRSLKTARDSIVNIFADRSSNSVKQLQEWMSAETWFTAQEALDAKLVDTITERKAIYNSAKIKVARKYFRNYPDVVDSNRTPLSIAAAETDSLNLRRRQLQAR